MKISLYPTADGCLRPDEVLSRARTSLLAGQRVAISSGDPAFSGLSGAILVRRIGRAWGAFHAIKPAVAIIDALDFTDPDGQEIIGRQEMPHSPPVPVAGDQFRRMLDLLRDRSGTEEVLMVSVNNDISTAWLNRLDRWDVHIRQDLADSSPWRTWGISVNNRGGEGESEYPAADRFPLDGNPIISQFLHTPRTHLLLAMAMEYTDVFCQENDISPDSGFRLTDNPGRLLVRMLAGKPVAERIRHCRQLEEDFRLLAAMAGEYLKIQTGAGTLEKPKSVAASSSFRPMPAHPLTGRKLH